MKHTNTNKAAGVTGASRGAGDIKSKLRNALWWFVLGDCWGVPYEFRTAKAIRSAGGAKKFHGYGTYRQPPGTYSDDTVLMLTLLQSYGAGRSKQGFDMATHKRYLKDIVRGRFYIDNHRFDIGIGTLCAIENGFRPKRESFGNGALLRCWPLIVELLQGSLTQKILADFIGLTHDATTSPDYATAVQIYLLMLREALLSKPDGSYPRYSIDRSSFPSGTVFHSVDVCQQARAKGMSVLDVISLGGDTDSDAALYGALQCNRSAPRADIRRIRRWEALDGYIEAFLSKLPF